MHISNRRETLILLLGDVACFFLALFLALSLRNIEIPTADLYFYHLYPFSILFGLSLIVFFTAGLYEKHTRLFQSRLPMLLFNAQMANALIAVVFFYFIPIFGINPKTILFLYLVTSFALIYVWRLYGRKLFTIRRKQKAILIGVGEELTELVREINNNPRYHFVFEEVVDLHRSSEEEILKSLSKTLQNKDISLIVADRENERYESVISRLYNIAGLNILIADFSELYEYVFDRVSLGSLNSGKFLELATSPTFAPYDILKRIVDLLLGFILTVIGIFLYPFIYFFIKIDDGGHIFIPQIRIGERGGKVTVYKLRTMERSYPRSDKWVPEEINRITRVGNILRRTSLDEVPQVFNVFKGEMSLIGPRADIEGLGGRLSKEIPNYTLRTLVKPGISGWAQIQQIYKKGNISPQSVEETKLRLAYDLYYIKNRSFFLDLKIIFRTITILLSRLGM
jgi:lipopolysaccharide/colanic/teichoic acid biosynthesis glycosyltransferase